MCSKCSVYKRRVDDKPTFRKIVLKIKKKNFCENNYVRYMLKQLFTSLSVNSADIYFHFGEQLLIIVKYYLYLFLNNVIFTSETHI